MNIPPQKQTLINEIVNRLAAVPGVQAVALGGSYARGRQHAESDLDVAIYYTESAPFAIGDIRAAANAFSVRGAPDVTDFYGWGAWVNGGAWIHTASGKVDFIYRSLEQVQRTIDETQQGITHLDFLQQPAYGFTSIIYLAETRICVPLYDPHLHLARLKAQVAVYPPRLKEKTVNGSLWLAEFSLVHAEKYARGGSVYATAGALTRTAALLTQALFALNETYFISDKTALQEIAAFAVVPAAYGERLNSVLAHPGHSPDELQAAVAAMHALWADVVTLTGGSYVPAFRI